ncbi:carbamoyltransferase HypF [Dehalobacter sp. DCM]|uniref:carbamoyltransferase HypF n=1 Tax=Dehalobacter sp. DCM TaxID=2907827 RepID=UPI003081819A|nr:carbamoyltransferase HypF [Dehalobacter sp. DCM]
MKNARYIKINGIVQGVGFRPFVYKLAVELNLRGWVINCSSGVEIHAEGENLEKFLQRILAEKPPMASIITHESNTVPAKGYTDFKIIESRESTKKDVLISPDIAVCPDCLNELWDKTDRRYRYPFINCTNCGPRYTIIKDRPYDRNKTTMDPFIMCPTCRHEYEDTSDRRFHAQPVACRDCGPSLQLWDADGLVVTNHGIGSDLLEKGSILAVKGIGGFHLVCDAYNDQAVKRLRHVKERGAKPFAVMARDMNAVRREVSLTELESLTLAGPSAPIVLLPRINIAESRLSAATAPGLITLGVMLPYTPVHHLLFDGQFDFLVMTSANLSGQPLIYDNDIALESLRGIADYFLVNNRDIYHPCDDSVLQQIGDKMTFIRRARGYVPVPLVIKKELKDPIVGLGGEMKNAFCLGSGSMAFMSQYIGDMHGLDNLQRFEQEFDAFQKVTSTTPKIAAYDLHPEYMTTRIAKALDIPKYTVQHHHAHLVSVMAEHGLEEPLLGIICDGTGYGDDGKIWGFEYMHGNAAQYQRLGHLEYLPLPGGDVAAKYPLRIAYAYLKVILTENEWHNTECFWSGLSAQEKDILDGQIRSGFQLFESSSAGRLFDAVSGMLGICTEVTYEGQAAIELESIAAAWLQNHRILKQYENEAIVRLNALINLRTDYEGIADQNTPCVYNMQPMIEECNKRGEECSDPDPLLYLPRWAVVDNGKTVILKIDRLLRQIIDDIMTGKNSGEIAFRFHYSLACMMLETAIILGTKKDLPVSGGVFQNKLLTECLLSLTGQLGIRLLYPTQLPSGDGGLAFGQVIIADEKNKRLSC